MSEIVLSQEALEELAAGIKRIVHLMAEIENAKEDITEQCNQIKEKVDLKAPEIKRIAKAVFDETYLDLEKEKLESLEDMVEALQGKL